MKKSFLILAFLLCSILHANADTAILQSADGNAISAANPLQVTLAGASGAVNFTGNVGIGSVSPTYDGLTLSNPKSIVLHRLTDQTTNTISLAIGPSTASVWPIASAGAGTQATLGLALSASSGGVTQTFTINRGSVGDAFTFVNNAAINLANVAYTRITPLLGGATHYPYVLHLNPTFTLTGSSSYDIFRANPTESTTGSGEKNLFHGLVGGTFKWRVDNTGHMFMDATVTAGGTTGAQTINKPAGTVNFAAAATSLVVTNSLVSTSSIVTAIARTNDSTCTVKNVVPGSGSFTINMTAGCTAETSVGFMVLN